YTKPCMKIVYDGLLQSGFQTVRPRKCRNFTRRTSCNVLSDRSRNYVLFAVRLPRGILRAMIRQIAPQFFTTDMRETLTYYSDKLGFDCVSTWQDPPVYAIVARDEHRIHFRCADGPTPNPEKYDDELLDAYVFVN